MSEPRWRKASFSQPNDDCVEVARLDEDTIGMRDSKHRGQGPVLSFSLVQTKTFFDVIQAGKLDSF